MTDKDRGKTGENLLKVGGKSYVGKIDEKKDCGEIEKDG
jgi:hypothetical protein